MFGSNRAGLVDSICDPAHQRPPANSSAWCQRSTSSNGSMAAWGTSRVVVGLTGQLVSDDRSHHPWTWACAAAAR
jgi:hypothetical protein